MYIWQTMVLEQRITQERHDNIELSLSEQLKQKFYKRLKDTNSYEQWRADIHRQLEEDLQRQVKQVLDESERQERLAKLRRQYLRTGQRLSSHSIENNLRPIDPWSEIERRNQRILYPLNARESYGANNYSSFNYQKNKLTTQRNDGNLLDNTSVYFQNIHKKQPILTSNHSYNSPFLYENNVNKSNKIDSLDKLRQQISSDRNFHIYVNKYGVIISQDGPFWPSDYRILYPTPKLLSRDLIPKEFYLTGNHFILILKN